MRRREFISLLGGAATVPLAGLFAGQRQGSPPEAPDLPLGAHPPPAPSPAPPPEPDVPLAAGARAPHRRADERRASRPGGAGTSRCADRGAQSQGLERGPQSARSKSAGRATTTVASGTTRPIWSSSTPELLIGTDRDTAKALLSAGGGMPVVFLNVVDPVGAGLVAALERPGGGVTGFCQTEFGASTQWPEILKRIAPNLMRVAIIHDPDVRPEPEPDRRDPDGCAGDRHRGVRRRCQELPRAGARRRRIFPHAQWRSDRRHGRAVVAASAAPSFSLRRASSCRRSMPTGCS